MSVLDGATSQPPRRRRRGSAAIAVALAVVILGGGAFAADRIAASQAEQRIEREVTSQLGAESVDVQIEGFPFLTQLLGGQLDEVTGTAADVTIAGVDLTDIAVTASGVPVRGKGTVSGVTASADLSTASLQALLDAELADLPDIAKLITVRPDGETIALDVDLGLFPVVVAVTPRPAGRSIGVTLTSVSAGGVSLDPSQLGIDASLVERLTSFTIDLNELPTGITISGVTVGTDGLTVDLIGNDVPIP